MKYSEYKMNPKEIMITYGMWLIISLVFAYFFYRSIWAFIFMLLFFPLFIRWQKKELIKKRKWKLCLDFREYISSIAINLTSGNSVENSFRKAYSDIAYLCGEKSDITIEAKQIIKGLDNNIVLENLLKNFGERSEISEIQDFADIFSAGKRTGGNLREIIEYASNQISEEIAMKGELKVLISEKEFEQKIMSIIPFFILLYVGITNKGYFDILYHNPTGIFIMTGLLIAYVVAFIWGKSITGKIY